MKKNFIASIVLLFMFIYVINNSSFVLLFSTNKAEAVAPLADVVEKNKVLKNLGSQKVEQSLTLDNRIGKHKTDELVVKFKTNSQRISDGVNNKLGVKVLKRSSKLGFERVRVPKDKKLEDIIKAYQENPEVEYVHPNYIYEQTMIPTSDELYTRQWYLSNINAYEAWDYTTGAPSVVIAVVDSGIDLDHPDLSPNILIDKGYDFVNYDIIPEDENGHGTHVAGIAAAGFNNGGIVGIAGGAKILPIKVLDRDGLGFDSDIAEGITYAVSQGADIINLSLGSFNYSPTVKDAIDYAYSQGVLVVAAAGNNSIDSVYYPARYPNVVAVSSTDKNNYLAPFSNWGRQLEVSAPGTEIYSTYNGNYYRYLEGTSMSTPIVSGLAALIWSKNPALSNAEVRQIIRDSSDDLGLPGYDGLYGYGKVNLGNALKADTSQIVLPSVSNTDMDHAQELSNGQAVSKTLKENYSEHWYKFKTNGDSQALIDLTVPGTMDGVIELYSSNFELIQIIDFGEKGISEKGTAYLAGYNEYYIAVYDYSNVGQTENYTLKFNHTLTTLTKDQWEYNEPVNLPFGTPMMRNLSPSGDTDIFSIYVKEEGQLELTLDVPAENDGYLILFDPQTKEFLAETNLVGLGQREVLRQPILHPGTYYAIVMDSFGTPSKNDYVIVSRFEPTVNPLKFISLVFDKNSPQKAGNIIRWTANAQGNDLDYAWYIYKDGIKVKTLWYSNSNYIEWNPLEPGNYNIRVFIKDSYGNKVDFMSPIYQITSAISIDSLEPTKSSPQMVGENIRWLVSAEGSNLSYAWYIYKNGTRVETVWYSNRNYLDWQPKEEGLYTIRVFVKDSAGNKVDLMSDQYTITRPSLQILSFEPDKISPQPGNTPIRWVVNAQGDNLTYAWYIYKNGLKISTIWYSSRNYLDWTPSEPGNYAIRAFVRDGAGNKIDQISREFLITEQPVKILSLSSDKASPQPINTDVRWTVDAQGKELKYAWYIYKDGIKIATYWYSNENHFNWAPKYPGIYNIRVFVQDGQGNKVDKMSSNFQITERDLRILSLNPDKPSPQLRGNTIRWTLTAQGQNLNYAWYIYKDGLKISTIWYSNRNYLDWKPDSGSYKIRAFVKDGLGNKQDIFSDYYVIK